jgi:nucleoside-diphosphate-sugar epimerase
MQRIGIIGADGFIGSELFKSLPSLNRLVIGITKENYQDHCDVTFDFLINANGNSNKYWANTHVEEDFIKSVKSVYNSFIDLKYKKYIYISSIDAENYITIYGYHKFIAEKLVSIYCQDYSIIRLPAVIGKNAKKGVVYDILNYNTIYLTKDSTLMLIDINEVTSLIKEFIENKKSSFLERFYPCNNITIDEISNILGIVVKYHNDLRKETYDYSGTYNTSSYYLKNMLEI